MVYRGSLLLALILLLVGRGILHRQKLHINEPVAIYIPSGSTFDQLVDSLEAHDCITDPAVFRSMARARHLTEHVKSGRYLLQPGMSLYQVVNTGTSSRSSAPAFREAWQSTHGCKAYTRCVRILHR